jgi:hypothetical protein
MSIGSAWAEHSGCRVARLLDALRTTDIPALGVKLNAAGVSAVQVAATTWPVGLSSSSPNVVFERIWTSFVAGFPLLSFVGTSTTVFISLKIESFALSPPLCEPRRSAVPMTWFTSSGAQRWHREHSLRDDPEERARRCHEFQ